LLTNNGAGTLALVEWGKSCTFAAGFRIGFGTLRLNS